MWGGELSKTGSEPARIQRLPPNVSDGFRDYPQLVTLRFWKRNEPGRSVLPIAPCPYPLGRLREFRFLFVGGGWDLGVIEGGKRGVERRDTRQSQYRVQASGLVSSAHTRLYHSSGPSMPCRSPRIRARLGSTAHACKAFIRSSLSHALSLLYLIFRTVINTNRVWDLGVIEGGESGVERRDARQGQNRVQAFGVGVSRGWMVPRRARI